MNTPLTRRQFVRTSAVAAAAFSAPLILPSRLFGAEAPSNKIRVGQIGCGRIARGHDMPGVFKSEGDALSWIKSRVVKGTILHADEASVWNDLHARFDVKRINHEEAGVLPLHQQSLAWGVSKKVKIVQRPDNQILLYWVTKNN